jgi:predicted protein tyrosine phosphatase
MCDCMRILFVCSGNAYRNPLAEALLRKLRPDLQRILLEYNRKQESREKQENLDEAECRAVCQKGS